MTTVTRPPQVWRGYDALAQADQPIGAHYSPNCLTTLRLLAAVPGATAVEIGREIGRKTNRVQRQTLARLVALELVTATGDDHLWHRRWWLTEHGRGLVALIDEEGIA
jgi:DNA-binding HxlR family transcriptional regulator